MPDKLTIDVTRDGWTGKLQLSISQLDEDGAGHGFRLAGPKFNGSSEPVLSRILDRDDAEEIRRYLDAVFPARTPEPTCDPANWTTAGDSTPQEPQP